MSKLKPFGNHIYVLPLKLLYRAILFIRELSFKIAPNRIYRSDHFTISIGGIHAGGTGKTPLTQLVAELVEKQLKHPVLLLSRGYKRSQKRPIFLTPKDECNFTEVGDEPTMLRGSLPGIYLAIGSNRKKILKTAEKSIPNDTTIILDDGYQHRQIARDINILTLPADPFFDHLIPAGRVREPLNTIKRADIVCIVGAKNEIDIMEISRKKIINKYNIENCFIMVTELVAWKNLKSGEISEILPQKNKKVISGIARPKRFIDSIDALNVTYTKSITYPDHHNFSIEEIKREFDAYDGIILTTEKDSVRLFSLNLVNLEKIWYLIIRLGFVDKISEQKFSKLVTSLYTERYNTLRGI